MHNTNTMTLIYENLALELQKKKRKKTDILLKLNKLEMKTFATEYEKKINLHFFRKLKIKTAVYI